MMSNHDGKIKELQKELTNRIHIRENQQAIFHLKDLLQRLPLSIERINNQVSPVDLVKLPRMNDRDIDSTTDKVELLWNFAIKLKNELIKANHDLKHKIDSVVKWTTEETQDREKERKDHVKALNDKDKIIQRYEVLTKVKDDDKRGLVSWPSGSITSKLQQQIFDLQKIMAHNNEQYKKVCMERDDLRNRLSSVAGEKLTKGNPSITDLGDPNRPMKIGEKYGELYDNEWTAAMENTIEAKKYYPDLKENEIEEIIIRHLHKLLKCCYIECTLKAEEQIHKLGEALAETMCFTIKTKDEIASLPVIREALVLRRAKSKDFAKFLFENQVICNNIIADWDYVNKNENLMQILTQSTFFEKCIYLCWCMVIQDPVMYLDDDPASNTPIDKNTYKEFVKSGDSVSYVVWPALFLHKDGPLLYKGVVQAYWKKDDHDNIGGNRGLML
ncbi:Hypothetical predicted protein [Mytilus galloprovincialis]|uniref:Mitochondria-eating protein C-terminal domain-containing protein n=1 Tax=Mytilus galloprovincialis TaxID=29158 RepID=A0A8B6FC67_MYTGA|nr:Hypothetical predicted protein [Mytilus galloprovincialis]